MARQNLGRNLKIIIGMKSGQSFILRLEVTNIEKLFHWFNIHGSVY